MPYISVYIDPSDALADLEDAHLVAELDRRRQRSGLRKPDFVMIQRSDLDEVADRLICGQIEDALLLLERLLPARFRHLSEEVTRFFGRPQ